MRMRVLLALGSVFWLTGPAAPADLAPIPLTTAPIASGFDRPLFLTSPPGDARRLFVLEQVTGLVRIVRDGRVLPEPFLDLGRRINRSGGERGLLGLAFHPDYGANGFFYVNYTAPGFPGDTVVARYRVSRDPDRADPDSETVLLGIEQPYTNHNGGMLAFGPLDGYLYIASGDGGSANDPEDHGQRLDTLLGKLLRIDVDAAAPYAVPPDNPFTGGDDAEAAIWAYGLRNPWRFSFDRLTGDLYTGDVGQGAREEINFQPASSPGGENYGWKVAEGFACRGGLGSCGTQPGFTPPIHDYGRDAGISVTGGYVYRGSAIPDLPGTYFFGDFGSGRVWTLRYADGSVRDFQERTLELKPTQSSTLGNISSFGEDARGELYILDYSGGRIFKIAPAILVGDVNGNGAVNAIDVQLTINGALGIDVGAAEVDINRDGVVDALDVQLVVNAVLRLL